MSITKTREVFSLPNVHYAFKSKIVEKGKEEFRPIIHITKPVVRLTPSKQYFTLKDVSYKRVEASTKKTKKKQISK